MNKEIPGLAYIEQQILGPAAAGGDLRSHVGEVEAAYGLLPGTLGDGLFFQTRLLSLLYLLVLFPKEYWGMDKNDSIYREIEERWSLDRIRVITADEKYGKTVYGFIHRLRNALAHADIRFHGDEIEITDSWKGQIVYRVRISNDEIEFFLETVGAIMANRRNWAMH